MNKNILWLEKYRPRTISDYIGKEEDIEIIKEWIENYHTNENNYKFLILYGDPGVGKTTLAHLILNTYDYELVEINTSHYRSKKMIKERVGILSGGSSIIIESKKDGNYSYKKIGLLMDEIDGASFASDSNAIQELMDIVIGKKKKRKTNRFPIICTCNSVKNKKLQILMKHSLCIKITKPTRDELYSLAKKINDFENIELKPKTIQKIAKHCFDYRTLINNLYQLNIYNKNNKKEPDKIKRKQIINSILNINKISSTTNESSTTNGSSTTNETLVENIDDRYNIILNKNISSLEKAHQKIKYIIDNNKVSSYDIKTSIDKDSNVFFLSLASNFMTLLSKFKLSKEMNYKILKVHYDSFIYGDLINKAMFVNQWWSLFNYVNHGSVYPNILMLKNNHMFFNKKEKPKILENDNYQLEYHQIFNKLIQDDYLVKKKQKEINTCFMVNGIQTIYYMDKINSSSVKYKSDIKKNKELKLLDDKMGKISKKIDDYIKYI